MVNPKEPIHPKEPSTHSTDQSAKIPKHFESQYQKIVAKPMTFLGMHFNAKEAGQLWNAIIQQVNSQIQHEQKRALKAIRKLRKSEQGDD